jgi:HEPN domain-containing protein
LKENRTEALRWLRQAENDLEYAALGLSKGFYAQVCFQCQQVCEKALKSIHYGKLAKRMVFGHSLVELSQGVNLGRQLVEEMSILDQYYIPTRYPNGLPGAGPDAIKY